MNFLLWSGSFHTRSASLALLAEVARQLDGHRWTLPALDQLPFYSVDLDLATRPPAVAALLAQVEAADGIICCSPEYNHSIPAVLKNAIDWASRPAFHSPLRDKPVTLITQASSPVGGARAQAHLKLVFDSTLSRIHPCHEMMVTAIDQKIDGQGQLTDAQTRTRIERHLQDFIGFIG
jgi:chromate reductase